MAVARQKEDKKLLRSVIARWQSWPCGQNLYGLSYTADDSWIGRLSNSGQREEKGLRVYDGDHDGAVRIFVGLSCERWSFFNCFTLHYAAQFSLYQECNYVATGPQFTFCQPFFALTHEPTNQPTMTS